MGLILETVCGRALNPGATITAVTAGSGDSTSIKDFDEPAAAYLEGIWAFGATAGVARLLSTRMHDNVQNLRWRTLASTVRNFISEYSRIRMYANDTPTFGISGGGAETECLAWTLAYENLAGMGSRLASWEQIQPRIQYYLTQEVAVVDPTTAGDWSAGTALNATFDNLRADLDYAVLGYYSDTNIATVALRGPDTGQVRYGGPGTNEAIETRDYFVDLSRRLGQPRIPVIKANNKAATLVFTQRATAAGGTANIGLLCAALSPGSGF